MNMEEMQGFSERPTLFMRVWRRVRGRKKFVVAVTVMVIFVLFLMTRGGEEEVPQPTKKPIEITKDVESWETYTSEEGYSFRYPHGTSVGKKNEVLKVVLVAEDAEKAGELYDALYMVFRVGDLGGESLENIARRFYEETKREGVIVEELRRVSVLGRESYTFAVGSSVGFMRYYHFALEGGRYLRVGNGSEDYSGQGFEEMAESILSSLEF